MNLGVLTGLDYYIHIKLKSALNISYEAYDATLSTDICDIVVLTQNKLLPFTLCVNILESG